MAGLDERGHHAEHRACPAVDLPASLFRRCHRAAPPWACSPHWRLPAFAGAPRSLLSPTHIFTPPRDAFFAYAGDSLGAISMRFRRESFAHSARWMPQAHDAPVSRGHTKKRAAVRRFQDAQGLIAFGARFHRFRRLTHFSYLFFMGDIARLSPPCWRAPTDAMF